MSPAGALERYPVQVDSGSRPSFAPIETLKNGNDSSQSEAAKVDGVEEIGRGRLGRGSKRTLRDPMGATRSPDQ